MQQDDPNHKGAPTPNPQPIPNPKRPNGAPIPFSHPAEEAFARVLDFYRTRWEYEPTTFPLEWDENGRVTNAFSPDFYLADEDLYVELTTMKQSLVTRKNRKLRLLRELYPGVRCKLIYRKDVASLAVKYGLFDEPDPENPLYNPHQLTVADGNDRIAGPAASIDNTLAGDDQREETDT
jgi:hypoxanthine phosphoribosyltransferase